MRSWAGPGRHDQPRPNRGYERKKPAPAAPGGDGSHCKEAPAARPFRGRGLPRHPEGEDGVVATGSDPRGAEHILAGERQERCEEPVDRQNQGRQVLHAGGVSPPVPPREAHKRGMTRLQAGSRT